MAGRVDWYGNDVKATLRGAVADIMAKAAFQVEGQAKANIVANGQVDTGFMLNSVYAITGRGSNYGQARAAAEGRNPEAVMGPQASLIDGASAAVGVGASYAAFQEIQQSFLYRALQALTTIAEFSAIVDEATSDLELTE